jgi:hypothetical protein
VLRDTNNVLFLQESTCQFKSSHTSRFGNLSFGLLLKVDIDLLVLSCVISCQSFKKKFNDTHAGFEVLTAVIVKNTIIWDATHLLR